MPNIDPALLAKMQKLQTLASHNSATVGEAASAAGKLQELLLRHNLTQDILNIDPILWDTVVTNEQAYEILLNSLCKANFCSCISVSKTSKIRFVGATEHVTQVKFMFYWLWAIIEPMTIKHANRGKRAAESFRMGCCIAIAQRLTEMHRGVQQEPGMMDIILAKDARAKEALFAEYPNARRRIARTRIDNNHYQAGSSFGANISLQRPIAGKKQICQ